MTNCFSYPPIEFSPRIQEKKLGIRKIFLHGFVFSIHGFEFPLTGLFFPVTGLSFHSRVDSSRGGLLVLVKGTPKVKP